MTHDEKITWMAVWAAKNKLALTLEGEVGIGRPCVGVSFGDTYPDYHWSDPNTYERVDLNGDVWVPENAYHKHPCVAVLGRGEDAEAQLYEWLKWFDANGFKLETGDVSLDGVDRATMMIKVMLGQHRFVHLVRHPKEST